MASANQTTSNDEMEKEINESGETSVFPVPAKRKNKVKADEAVAIEDGASKIQNDDALVSVDNSRVVFVDKEIVKSEVSISNTISTKDCSSSQTITESEMSLNQNIPNTPPDYPIANGNTKSKIANFIEKFNSSTANSQGKIIVCKVSINDTVVSKDSLQSEIRSEIDTVNKMVELNEEIQNTINSPSDVLLQTHHVDSKVDNTEMKKSIENSMVKGIQSMKNIIEIVSSNNVDALIKDGCDTEDKLKRQSEDKEEKELVTEQNKSVLNDVPRMVLPVPINKVPIPAPRTNLPKLRSDEPQTSTSIPIVRNIDTKSMLENTTNIILEQMTRMEESKTEVTENINLSDVSSQTYSETKAEIISVKNSSQISSISTQTEHFVMSENQDLANQVNKMSKKVVSKIPSPKNSHNNVSEIKSINNNKLKSSTSSDLKTNIEILRVSKVESDIHEVKKDTSLQRESYRRSNENVSNQASTQTKPTITMKPTTIIDQTKTEKVLNSNKIPTLEKSLSLQEKEMKLKKMKPSEKCLSLENEPRLTRKQRTSSEQFLNIIKGDSDVTITKKLRATVELLQQENSTSKRLLESERSAFREHRAVSETELRKEKAEARRREAALESQVRAALKGQPVLVKGASGPGDPVSEVARLTSALESAKSANKSLQEKLQMVMEADKRKVAELRTEHDAHAAVVQQMERDARAQTAKLLEELKSKERQLEQMKKERGKVTPPVGGGGKEKDKSKMAVADQLHLMEGQISRLENEIQRKDDIIQSLRSSKVKRDRRLSSHRQSKDNLFKDIISDVDSAVSSAPNSLSPQPSPDLWYRPHDGAQVEVDEGLLETAKKQIQELEKTLSVTTASQKQAQLKATQLEEQLQDLREHADLLEFRCLELEDSNEKRNSLEELTDSDSGCTSPENRLKNSVSPHLRRSDSGYKSPTRPSSPNLKSLRVITTPAAFSDCNTLSYSDNQKGLIPNLNLHDIDNMFDSGNEDIRDRLERMLLRTNLESDRICLEQVLQLLWNLQALSTTLNDDNYTGIKHKKGLDSEISKNDYEQTKSGKIIATISPYSQKSSIKSNDLTKSASDNNESELVNISIKEDSKKLLYGLQESGIFDEADWDTKGTQTDWCDCICTEPESDLATEVQRLNQIREQLEKSGAIGSKNLKNKTKANDSLINDHSLFDTKQQKKRERKKLEFYESRIALLENKVAIYESSGDTREKKLAQRLQKEINLETKIKNLEFDLSKLRKKFILLEEERCEFEEAENDTRLHCQELEAEFDILSAKLRDLDDQKNCAKNEAECYRQLVEEYEYKTISMQQQEVELRNQLKVMEKTLPALVSFNIYKTLEELYGPESKTTQKNSCHQNQSQSLSKYGSLPMIDYPCTSQNPFSGIERQLNCYVDEHQEVKILCKNRDEKRASRHKSSVPQTYASSNGEHCNCRTQAGKKLEEFLSNECKMKQRIEELEKRELAYLETLTKGDEMWAEMEFSYKQKIKEMEQNDCYLMNDRNKWKGRCEQLETKIHELEENEELMKCEMKELQEELRDLGKQKESLNQQVCCSRIELVQNRVEMEQKENELKMELLAQRKLSDTIQEELEEQKKAQCELECTYECNISHLKRELMNTCSELKDQRNAVDGLLDQVQLLEKKLNELTCLLCKQKIDFDEKTKSLLDEIHYKSNEVEQLKEELIRSQKYPSAHEELEQMYNEDSNHQVKRTEKSCKCGEEKVQAITPPAKCYYCGEKFDHIKNDSKSLTHSSTHCTCGIESKQTKSEAFKENAPVYRQYEPPCCEHQKRSPLRTQEQVICRKIQVDEINAELVIGETKPEIDLSPMIIPCMQDTCKPLMVPPDTPPKNICCKAPAQKVVEKPELPKRKPKIAPKVMPKLKVEELKKKLPPKPTVIKKKEDVKPRNSVGIASPPPIRTVDRGDCCKSDVEKMCQILNDPLDSCLDEYTLTLCRQNEDQDNLKLDGNSSIKAIDGPKQFTVEQIQSSNKKSTVIEESSHNELKSNETIKDSFDDCNITQGINVPVVTKPSVHINSIKRYHSLSESRELHQNEIPTIMSKSDSAVSHTSATARELIASFNNMNGASKSNLETNTLKQVTSNQSQGQPKSIGSLVFDRVTKLTNGLAGSRILGLKRSVSMIADSKSATNTAFHVSVDL